MTDESNYPLQEEVTGIPIVLDLATSDDITIKNLQLTLVDAVERGRDSKEDKDKADNLSDAIHTIVEYLLPDANYEQWAFDTEQMINAIENPEED